MLKGNVYNAVENGNILKQQIDIFFTIKTNRILKNIRIFISKTRATLTIYNIFHKVIRNIFNVQNDVVN